MLKVYPVTSWNESLWRVWRRCLCHAFSTHLHKLTFLTGYWLHLIRQYSGGRYQVIHVKRRIHISKVRNYMFNQWYPITMSLPNCWYHVMQQLGKDIGNGYPLVKHVIPYWCVSSFTCLTCYPDLMIQLGMARITTRKCYSYIRVVLLAIPNCIMSTPGWEYEV